VQALTNEWISYFSKAGVPDTDIETLKGIIPSWVTRKGNGPP